MKTDKRLLELAKWAEENAMTQYEAAYELVFTFYETAGFRTDLLEEELNSKSEEGLYEIFLMI